MNMNGLRVSSAGVYPGNNVSTLRDTSGVNDAERDDDDDQETILTQIVTRPMTVVLSNHDQSNNANLLIAGCSSNNDSGDGLDSTMIIDDDDEDDQAMVATQLVSVDTRSQVCSSAGVECSASNTAPQTLSFNRDTNTNCRTVLAERSTVTSPIIDDLVSENELSLLPGTCDLVSTSVSGVNPIVYSSKSEHCVGNVSGGDQCGSSSSSMANNLMERDTLEECATELDGNDTVEDQEDILTQIVDANSGAFVSSGVESSSAYGVGETTESHPICGNSSLKPSTLELNNQLVISPAGIESEDEEMIASQVKTDTVSPSVNTAGSVAQLLPAVGVANECSCDEEEMIATQLFPRVQNTPNLQTDTGLLSDDIEASCCIDTEDQEMITSQLANGTISSQVDFSVETGLSSDTVLRRNLDSVLEEEEEEMLEIDCVTWCSRGNDPETVTDAAASSGSNSPGGSDTDTEDMFGESDSKRNLHIKKDSFKQACLNISVHDISSESETDIDDDLDTVSVRKKADSICPVLKSQLSTVSSDRVFSDSETDAEEMLGCPSTYKIDGNFNHTSKALNTCNAVTIPVSSQCSSGINKKERANDEVEYSNDKEAALSKTCSSWNKMDPNREEVSVKIDGSDLFNNGEGESTDDEEMISTQFNLTSKKADSVWKRSNVLKLKVSPTEKRKAIHKMDLCEQGYSGGVESHRVSFIDKFECTNVKEIASVQLSLQSKGAESSKEGFSGEIGRTSAFSADEEESTDDEEMFSIQYCSAAKRSFPERAQSIGNIEKFKIPAVDNGESTDDEEMISTQFHPVSKKSNLLIGDFSGGGKKSELSSIKRAVSTDDEEMISTQFIPVANDSNQKMGELSCGSGESKLSTIDKGESMDDEGMILTQFCAVPNKVDSRSNDSCDDFGISKLLSNDKGEATNDEEMISTQFCVVPNEFDSRKKDTCDAFCKSKLLSADNGESTDEEEMISTQFGSTSKKLNSKGIESTFVAVESRFPSNDEDGVDDEEMISTQFLVPSKKLDSSRRKSSDKIDKFTAHTSDAEVSTDDEEMLLTQICPSPMTAVLRSGEGEGKLETLGAISTVEHGETVSDEEMFADDSDKTGFNYNCGRDNSGTFKVPLPLKFGAGTRNVSVGNDKLSSGNAIYRLFTSGIDSVCSSVEVDSSRKGEGENASVRLKVCRRAAEKPEIVREIDSNQSNHQLDSAPEILVEKSRPCLSRSETDSSKSKEESSSVQAESSKFQLFKERTNDFPPMSESASNNNQQEDCGELTQIQRYICSSNNVVTDEIGDSAREGCSLEEVGELTQIQHFIGTSNKVAADKDAAKSPINDHSLLEDAGELTQIQHFMGTSDKVVAGKDGKDDIESPINDHSLLEDAGELTQLQHFMGTLDKVVAGKDGKDDIKSPINDHSLLEDAGELTQIQHFMGTSDKVVSNKINASTNEASVIDERSQLEEPGELTQIQKYIGSSANVISSGSMNYSRSIDENSHREEAGELTQIQRFIGSSDQALSSRLCGDIEAVRSVATIHSNPVKTESLVKQSQSVGNCDLISIVGSSPMSDAGELTQIQRFMCDSSKYQSPIGSNKQSDEENWLSTRSDDMSIQTEINRGVLNTPRCAGRLSLSKFFPSSNSSIPRMPVRIRPGLFPTAVGVCDGRDECDDDDGCARGSRSGQEQGIVASDSATVWRRDSPTTCRPYDEGGATDDDFFIMATPEVVAVLEHQRNVEQLPLNSTKLPCRGLPGSPWVERQNERDVSTITPCNLSRRLLEDPGIVKTRSAPAVVVYVDSEDELPELAVVEAPACVGITADAVATSCDSDPATATSSSSSTLVGDSKQSRSRSNRGNLDGVCTDSVVDRGESTGVRRSKRQRCGTQPFTATKRSRTVNYISNALSLQSALSSKQSTDKTVAGTGTLLRSTSDSAHSSNTNSSTAVVKRQCWSTSNRSTSAVKAAVTTVISTVAAAVMPPSVSAVSLSSLLVGSEVSAKIRGTTPKMPTTSLSVSSAVPVTRLRRVQLDNSAHSRSLGKARSKPNDSNCRNVGNRRVRSAEISTPDDSNKTLRGSPLTAPRRSARLKRLPVGPITQTSDKTPAHSPIDTTTRSCTSASSIIAVSGMDRSSTMPKSSSKSNRKTTRRIVRGSSSDLHRSTSGCSTSAELLSSCPRLRDDSASTRSEVTRPRRTTRFSDDAYITSGDTPKATKRLPPATSNTPSLTPPQTLKDRSTSKPSRSRSSGSKSGSLQISSVSYSAPLILSPRHTSFTPPASDVQRVMFTGSKDEHDMRTVQLLGGVLVERARDCTVLVCDSVRRTIKFLCAITLGRPIVTAQWLEASRLAGKWLDPWQYLLVDRCAERRFGFRLSDSLRRAVARSGDAGLLSDWRVYATPSVLPPPHELKELVETASGTFLETPPDITTTTPNPTTNNKSNRSQYRSSHSNTTRQSLQPPPSSSAVEPRVSHQLIAISCEKDRSSCWERLQRAGFKLVSSEAVLSLLLRQETDGFDLARYML